MHGKNMCVDNLAELKGSHRYRIPTESYKNRLSAVIASKGCATKYQLGFRGRVRGLCMCVLANFLLIIN